jgi:hypothetical protein
MAVKAERFCNGDHVPDDAPRVDTYEVDRSGESRGKPLDAGSAIPIVVEILGGGLCSVVGVVLPMMMIKLCMMC